MSSEATSGHRRTGAAITAVKRNGEVKCREVLCLDGRT